MHFEKKLLAFSLFVLLIRQSTGFTCSDGCDIFDSYVEDDYCDCVDCSDESSWDCTSCGGCPSQCGTWVYCSPLISSNISINTNDSIGFLCDDGCVVDESFENDDWCDCSNCEDETSTGWDCNNCQCPTECGTYYSCPGDDGSSLTTTGKPSGFTTTSYGSHAAPTMSTSNVYNFSCNDGCTVPYYWVNDDWCDCGECEDEYETGWTCSSCLCPTECGIYYHCDNSSNGAYGSTRASDSDKYFFCDDGCKIDESWQNDHYCDCQNCEDETDWDCQSCGKCPHTCGDYIYCLLNDNDNSDSNEHYSTTIDGGEILSTYDTTYGNTYTSFTCDDGCVVDYSSVNDNWCHCSNCEDEYTTGWSCDNCTCPTECGDYYHCYLNNTGSGGENVITTRNGNGNGNATFGCEDGCHIPVSYVNDNYCDCSECEDEESWDCDSCHCPTTRCDDFYLCDGEWTGTDSDDNVAPNNNIFDTSTSSGQIALAITIIGIVVILIFIAYIAVKGIGRAKQKNSSRNNEMTMDAVVEAQRQSLKTHHGALGGSSFGSSLGSPLDSPLGSPSNGALSDTETGGENIYSNDDNNNNNNNKNGNDNDLNPQLEMNEIINVYKDTNGLSDGE